MSLSCTSWMKTILVCCLVRMQKERECNFILFFISDKYIQCLFWASASYFNFKFWNLCLVVIYCFILCCLKLFSYVVGRPYLSSWKLISNALAKTKRQNTKIWNRKLQDPIAICFWPWTNRAAARVVCKRRQRRKGTKY